MSITLDLASCPFSRFGSYFSLSHKSGKEGDLGEGLYINTHHGGSAQAFLVELAREDAPVPFEIDAGPTKVVLSEAGGGRVALVITEHGALRIRGTGVSLRLQMPTARWRFAYPLADATWAFNLPKSDVQFAIECISGALGVHAPWGQGQGFCKVSTEMIALLSPDSDGVFDAAIDDFSTTWIRPERETFSACEDEVNATYTEWIEGLPPVAPALSEARERAGYVNWSAVVHPTGNLTRPTMLMSKMSMCNVFGWDHAFNAMALVNHDPDLAWDQLMVFAEKEDQFGKVPDNMNDRDIMHTFAKPPIHGWALRRMWSENPSLMTMERREEAYRHLASWVSWWTDHRTWGDETLPHYIHGFDSGWDNSTIFDEGTPLVSPDLAAYAVLQMEVLGELADTLGKASEAATWKRKSEEMLGALMDELWRGDRFVGIIRPSGRVVECESLITCMPIVLGRRLPQEVQRVLVERIREHQTEWGLATEKPSSPEYKELSYWRGPIWAPPTLLAVSGLEEIGEVELVRSIVDGFCRMCEQNGFAENFDAKSGASQFDPAYTWTSSVFLILASHYR